METLKTLEEQISKLQEKQTWVRNGLEKFLEIWADKTQLFHDDQLDTVLICQTGRFYVELGAYIYIRPGIADIYVADSYDWESWETYGTPLRDKELDIERVDFEIVKCIVNNLKPALERWANKLEEASQEIDKLLKILGGQEK